MAYYLRPKNPDSDMFDEGSIQIKSGNLTRRASGGLSASGDFPSVLVFLPESAVPHMFFLAQGYLIVSSAAKKVIDDMPNTHIDYHPIQLRCVDHDAVVIMHLVDRAPKVSRINSDLVSYNMGRKPLNGKPAFYPPDDPAKWIFKPQGRDDPHFWIEATRDTQSAYYLGGGLDNFISNELWCLLEEMSPLGVEGMPVAELNA